MSAEVQVETTEDPEVPARTLPTPVATKPRPPLWRRRRYQISGSVLVIAVVAAFVGNNFLARQYTPDGAVREYMTALQAGDAIKAWNAIQVTAPTATVAATVADRNALQAALAAGRPDIKDFTVTSTNQLDSTTTAVEVTYDTSAGSKQAKFLVQRSGQTHLGIYPVWHLVITPTILEITLPKGTSGVSIDGKAVALPQGTSSIAVLPVAHKLQFNGTAVLSAQAVSVDAFHSLAQSVTYAPSLTSDGLAKTKAAINAYFAACTKQTSLSPAGCPQGESNGFVSSGQWQLVGDPTQDLAIGFDKNLNPVGTGHFQMVIAYQEDGYTGTLHDASSGGYSAGLVLTSSDVTVTSITSDSGLAGLQRPTAATDQAAKDLVAKAFAQCAAARAAAQADCPQGLAFPDVTNVSWSLTGDPLSAATVIFDPQSGLFTVQGTFTMTTQYYVQGYPYSRPSYNTTYKAYLLWDGQALRLVTISGD
ncbi:MAG: hypothetical protein ACYDAL_17095 [Candidatus Dormibacteraceae bacterium]